MGEGTVRFEILGPVRAFRDDEPVDLGPIHQRAVLAVLLLRAGEPVPVPEIVAALWGGDPPSNGIDVVQRFVGGLRRALGPAMITLTDGGYLLRAAAEAVDTGQFRTALDRARSEHRTGNVSAATDEVRHALTLWQDQPLAGLTGPFFDSARARLDEEHAGATELLAKPIHLAPPLDPTRVDHPVHPEAVDPWAGHDLFPPDPLSMA